MKQSFLDIYLTMSFDVHYFRKTLAMSVIFFFKNVQNLIYILKNEKKI